MIQHAMSISMPRSSSYLMRIPMLRQIRISTPIFAPLGLCMSLTMILVTTLVATTLVIPTDMPMPDMLHPALGLYFL